MITTVLEGFGKPLSSLSVDYPTCQSRQEDSKCSIVLKKLEHLRTIRDMTEREIITVLALSELLRQDSSGYKPLQASALILHTALLRLYPLSARRFDRAPLKWENEEFLLQFSQECRNLLQMRSYKQILGSCPLRCDLIDLLDGRIFHAVAHALHRDLKVAAVDRLLWSEYQRFAAILGNLCNFGLPVLTSQKLPLSTASIQELSGQATVTSPTSRPPTVMPFKNSIFDHHLAAIQLTTDDALPKNSHTTSAKTFKEISHWHNSKRRIGHKTPSPKLGFFAHRRNQWFMSEMIAYAASLTNAVGKTLEPEVIVPNATNDPNKDRKKLNGKDWKDSAKRKSLERKPLESNLKNKKGGLNSGKAAAYAAAAACKASKVEAKGTQSLATWRLRCKELDEEEDPLIRYSMAQKIRFSLGKPEVDVVGTEVELYAVSVLTLIWMKYCQDGKRAMGKSSPLIMWSVTPSGLLEHPDVFK